MPKLSKTDVMNLARLAKLHKMELSDIDNMHHLRIAFIEIGEMYKKMVEKNDDNE